MDMQNVAKLDIPEGEVRTIHDENGNLIWGKVSYGVKYKGDTAQNGTPTSDAPVAVQTVTGENMVKISDGQGNEQSYSISLGSIELCKIGDYQDYIWKDGNTWKVHKAVTKATYDGSENWAISNSGTANYYYRVASGIITPSDTTNCLSNYETARQVLNSNTVNGIWKLAGGQIRIRSGQELSLADWKSKLASKPLDFYVALAIPTDTEITNEALVGQLGAVEQWLTRYGYDATVTGNLPIIIDRTAL